MGTFEIETTNINVAKLQVQTQARISQVERSRGVVRDLIGCVFAGERSGYRWGEDDDNRPLELPLNGVVLKCGRSMCSPGNKRNLQVCNPS